MEEQAANQQAAETQEPPGAITAGQEANPVEGQAATSSSQAEEKRAPELESGNTPEQATALEDEATTLPPEAQGETNGGPLGCCLGVMVGLLLSLIVGVLSRLYADQLGELFQHNFAALGITTRVVMALLAVAFAILCGYFGWKIGRRLYKEYELSPRQKRKLAQLEQRQRELDRARSKTRSGGKKLEQHL